MEYRFFALVGKKERHCLLNLNSYFGLLLLSYVDLSVCFFIISTNIMKENSERENSNFVSDSSEPTECGFLMYIFHVHFSWKYAKNNLKRKMQINEDSEVLK